MAKLRAVAPLLCVALGVTIGGAYVVSAVAQDGPVTRSDGGPGAGVLVVSDAARTAAEKALAGDGSFRSLIRGAKYTITDAVAWTAFEQTRQVGLVLTVVLDAPITIDGKRPTVRYPQASSENARPDAATSYGRSEASGRVEDVSTVRVWYDEVRDAIVGIVPWPSSLDRPSVAPQPDAPGAAQRDMPPAAAPAHVPPPQLPQGG